MSQTTVSTSVDAPAPPMTRTVLGLAGPVVVERLSVSILSVVDAVLVGHYVGADGVAAVGIGGLLFWVPFSGAFGIDIATTAIVARDFGAGATHNVERTVRMSLLLAALWGVASTALLWPLAPALLTMMAASPEVKDFGVEYIRAASLGFPLLMVLYASSGAMRGLGNTFIPMLILIVLNGVNALVTFLLISGVVGVELNVLASGIGFACGGIAGGLLALAVLASGLGPVRYHVSQALATGREEFRRLVNVGLPTSLEELQFMIAFIAYSRVVTGLGTVEVAAHTVALRTLELALVPGFSLGTAATTLVSRYLGAKQPDTAEQAALTARNWAVGAMLVMGALLAVFAPQFVRIFVDDEEVVEVGAELLRIFAIAFPFMGLHASLSGTLRGAGDVRYVLGVLTVTAWLVRIPTAVLLGSVLGLGAPGAWMGAVAENIARAGLIWRRFRQNKWKEIEV